MSCCGQRRSQFVAEPARPKESPMRYSVAYFEATRPLEALGASGKRYRFEGPGDVVAVDLHDRRSMLAVQGLRQVVDL